MYRVCVCCSSPSSLREANSALQNPLAGFDGSLGGEEPDREGKGKGQERKDGRDGTPEIHFWLRLCYRYFESSTLAAITHPRQYHDGKSNSEVSSDEMK